MQLYLIAALTDFIQSLFLFTATRYLAEQVGDALQLGIVGGSLSLTYAGCAALFGHLSDSVGRRRFIVMGSAVFVLGLGLALHSMDAPLVYVEAALIGMASAMVFPPLIVLLTSGQRVGDVGREASEPLVLFCLSWNLGVMAGQSSAGFLFGVDPGLSLKVAIVASLAIIPMVASAREVKPKPQAMPEAPAPKHTAPKQTAPKQSSPKQSKPAAVPVPVRFFAFAGWMSNIMSALSMSLIICIFPQLATDLGIQASVHGPMLAGIRVVVISMYFLLHFTYFWRHRISPSLTVKAVAAAGMLLLTFATTVPLLTAGLMCVGMMAGYVYFSSIFYTTTSFGIKKKGVAGGMHEASLALGFSAGAIGGGYLSLKGGLRLPYQVCVVLLAVTILLQSIGYLGLRRRAAK